jgi:amino acid transporter
VHRERYTDCVEVGTNPRRRAECAILTKFPVMRATAASTTRRADDLSRFGYAQELFRSMGGFSNFAISFSIISILTGAVTLYGYGLEMGGPLEMTLGWPIATLFTLAIAGSMAELCSAYPTSGAMYHWAADLGGPAWGWFAAWFNIFGLIAAQAGINYSCAQFILPFLGIPATTLNLYLMFAFILANQAVLNQYGVRLVARLNDASVAVHIAGVIVIVAVLLLLAPQQPVSFLLQAVNSNGRSPYWWAFLLGLLQAHWTLRDSMPRPTWRRRQWTRAAVRRGASFCRWRSQVSWAMPCC